MLTGGESSVTFARVRERNLTCYIVRRTDSSRRCGWHRPKHERTPAEVKNLARRATKCRDQALRKKLRKAARQTRMECDRGLGILPM